MKRLTSLATVCLLAAAAALSIPVPAVASCAGPPSPSPYKFTGTVTSVQRGGLIAEVRADDGRQVTVHGTPSDNVDGVTSVDRHFTVGVRYEFHPVNNSSPYEDNACTATTAIAGAPSPAIGGTPSSPAGSGAAWIAGAAGLLVAALAALGWWLMRRRASSQMRRHITPAAS